MPSREHVLRVVGEWVEKAEHDPVDRVRVAPPDEPGWLHASGSAVPRLRAATTAIHRANPIRLPLDERPTVVGGAMTASDDSRMAHTEAVAAAPKKTVNKLISVFSKAGLEVSALIPVSLGLQNLINLSKERLEETVAVIEMGASVTELNIFSIVP